MLSSTKYKQCVKLMQIYKGTLTVAVLQERPLADEEIDGKMFVLLCLPWNKILIQLQYCV